MSNVGDETEVKNRRTKAKLAREREIAEVAKLMDMPAGRAFVWRLLERGGLHRLSFAGSDTHMTAFNEGRRDMANWILSECLTARPQCYTVMRNEAEDRRGEGEDG